MAQIVDADVEVDPGRLDGRPPDAGAKVFREIGVPSRVANSRSSGPRRRAVIQSASWSTRSGGRSVVRASLSFWYGLVSTRA